MTFLFMRNLLFKFRSPGAIASRVCDYPESTPPYGEVAASLTERLVQRQQKRG